MNLEQDFGAINSINKFREQAGLRKAGNPYSWFVCVMVAYTYYKTETTLSTVLGDLSSVGINIPSSCSNNWKKVALGEERDPTRRNYAFKLPGVAAACGLTLGKPKLTLGKPQRSKHGRPANTYFLKNTTLAKNVLLTLFPNTDQLFKLLDKKKF